MSWNKLLWLFIYQLQINNESIDFKIIFLSGDFGLFQIMPRVIQMVIAMFYS